MARTSTSTARPSTSRKATAAKPAAAKSSTTWSYEACKESLNNFKMSPRAKSIVAFVANICTIGATYYVGMSFTMQLALLVAGLSGSMFVTFMILFLGQVLSILLAIISGAKVHMWIIEDSYKTVLAAPGRFSAWLSAKTADKKPVRARA